MTLSTAVIIATKGRPREVSNLLDQLALQTVPPDLIVVSACDQSDVDPGRAPAKNVEIIFGPPGLPAQRNRALSRIHGKYDIVIFFDDDFIPSRFWIDRIRLLLTIQPEVGTVTGRVLIDGVLAGGLAWVDGQSMVVEADSSGDMATIDTCTMNSETPYGCNMAFRARTISGFSFDERLILYGWLEDLDFALRAGARAGMVKTDLVWGVHLGVKGGRDTGLKFGYSQVVNPWYLMKKGVLGRFDACMRICRGTAGNALMIGRKSHFDRWGRLMGNLIGIKDIILGRWAPERISEL